MVSIMSSLEVSLDSSHKATQSHVCPKCLGPMTLIRIKPSGIRFDECTFRGTHCDHIDKVVTVTQSMKWISSGLQAPV